MRGYVMIRGALAAGSRPGWLLASGAGPALAGWRALAFAALGSWLAAESLGAWMLRSWIASGGPRLQRAQPGGLPLPVIFGHAALAFTGLATWVGFLVTGYPALAWPAIALLTLAIGLGISTVTIWTPYPARRAAGGSRPPVSWRDNVPGRGPGPGPGGGHGGGAGGENGADAAGGHSAGGAPPGGPAARGPAPAGPAGNAPGEDVLADNATDEMLARTLADTELTSKLVDALLARMLAAPPPSRRRRGNMAPLIPVAHGVLAITTFLLAILAAVAAM